MSEMRFWRADPHEFGPGKTHLVADEHDHPAMLCGRFIEDVPGRWVNKPTTMMNVCKLCVRAWKRLQQPTLGGIE